MRGDILQVVDILGRVKSCHLCIGCSVRQLNRRRSGQELVTYIDVHLSVEAVVDDELVCHLDSEWLHRVLLSVEVGADFSVVEI